MGLYLHRRTFWSPRRLDISRKKTPHQKYPDSIKDDKGNTFYLVRIKTDKNYINHLNKHLRIIPGMTTSVDIITGKKSVLDYILKPILKTKQYMFTER